MLEVVVDFVKSSRKAFVAFAVTVIVAYVARKGYNVDVDTQTALRVLLDGVIAFGLTWLVPNKK